jgi:hypothetical protein
VSVPANDCAPSPERRPQLGQSRSGDRATGDREGEPYGVMQGIRKGRPVWHKLSGRPDAIQDAEGADDHKRRTHQAGVPPTIPNFLLLIVSEDSKKFSMPMTGFYLPIGSIGSNCESILRRFVPQPLSETLVRDDRPSIGWMMLGVPVAAVPRVITWVGSVALLVLCVLWPHLAGYC